nr:hypothetical protein [Candidatus Sigynarchaeota archaeon]
MVLDKIKVEILGAESMGVRSMCCRVTTPDVSFLLDPGCALGPRKGHEIPHPAEYKRLHEITNQLVASAKDCTRLFISHYHHDHYKPRLLDETYIHSNDQMTKDLYGGKEIYLKSQKQHIGRHQESRCRYFMQSVSRLATVLHDADFHRFTFGNTTVDFSHPVPHGEPGTKLGYVIMARFSHGNEHFVYAPDLQGPVVEDTAKFITGTAVDVAFVGGPPLYLEGSLAKFPYDVAATLAGKIHEKAPVLVMDHHCCRDREKYEAFVEAVKKGSNAPRGHSIVSAAVYMEQKPAFLESERGNLYEQEPPSPAFRAWMDLEPGQRNKVPPPLNP